MIIVGRTVTEAKEMIVSWSYLIFTEHMGVKVIHLHLLWMLKLVDGRPLMSSSGRESPNGGLLLYMCLEDDTNMVCAVLHVFKDGMCRHMKFKGLIVQ